MKCIKCAADNKLKDRTANHGHCKTCNHPFVFDPKTSQETDFTDQFFANLINAASFNDSLFFTPKQFYYLFNARKNKLANLLTPAGCGLIVLSVLVMIWFISLGIMLGLLIVVILFGAGLALFLPPVRKRIRRKIPRKVEVFQSQIERWIKRWEKVNGPVLKLLPPPATTSKPAKVSKDVSSYSFDRVVVCEHASVAHFLIANNFHFEHNCAVLSLDGYPQNIFDTVMEMLRRNPDLQVYALHDASPAGVSLPYRLRNDPKWFKEYSGVKIHDLGLLPRQLRDRSVFVLSSQGSRETSLRGLSPQARASLLPEEIRWLDEGKYVELESLSPHMLMRVVTQGIARSRDPLAKDALAPVGDTAEPGGIFIYTYDTFG